MEEEKNQNTGQELAEKVVQDVQDTSNMVKDGTKLAKDIGTGNVLGIAKDSLNLLKNKKVRRIILAIILIPIILVIFLASSLHSIYRAIVDKGMEILDSIVDFFTITADDGSINIDNDQIDAIIEGITGLGVDMDALKLMGDVDYDNPDVEKRNKEAMRKYIRKFYEAQAVTQTLNYHKGYEDPNKTYGRIYIKKAGQTEPLTYIAYDKMEKKTKTSEEGNTSTSFNNFLFIGDSRTEGIENKLEKLGENVNAIGVTSSNPGDWEEVTRTGGPSSIYNQTITLPTENEVSGISIALGVNNTSQTNRMKNVLNNLLGRYPSVKIYVNSVFHVGKGYNTINSATMNANIDKFNTEIKEFCNNNSMLTYIDITNGLYDESGYLKSDYSSDSLHLNNKGNDILIKNLKIKITGEEETTDNTVNQNEAEDLTDKFSINDNGEIVLPGWTRTVTEKNGRKVSDVTIMNLKTIDYRNVVSQYTTSMNFFLYLAMISQNPEFVAAVTDLVKQSKIELTVLETEITDIETTEYSYIEHRRETNEYFELGEEEPSYSTISSDTKKTDTTVVTTTTSIPTLAVTYVKTWFCEQTITYDKKEHNSGPVTSDPVLGEDEPPKEPAKDKVDKVTWITGKSTTYTTETKTTRYEEGTRGQVIDRTGEKGSQGLNSLKKVDENTTIVGLLDDKFKIPHSSREEKAGSNIVSGAEWLFDLMQQDPNLQSTEQIMRYVLYKYTGKDYGVTSLDFGIFNAKDFNSVNMMYGNSVEDKVWYALRDAGFSEYAVAGVMGNIYGESGFNPSIIEYGSGQGFGLCQWTAGRRTALENYASSKGVEPSDVNTQIEFLLTELTYGGAGPAQGYAVYQLLSYRGYNGDMWENAENPEDAAVAFCWSFERPGAPDLNTRKQAARRYYEEYKGKVRPTGGVIIQVADAIHKYMEENNYTYCVYSSNSYEECKNESHGLNSTFKASQTGYHHTCCATYVSWVLQEAGYITEAEHSNSAGGINNILIRKGWTQIFSTTELEPGDVLYYNYGHIAIYAGDGTVYNAGSGEAIRGTSPAQSGLSSVTYGLRAPN